MAEKEYISYGPEWVKEVKKMTKDQIIDLLLAPALKRNHNHHNAEPGDFLKLIKAIIKERTPLYNGLKPYYDRASVISMLAEMSAYGGVEQTPEGITKAYMKKQCTRFFRWWWNNQGTNTEEGFERWWSLEGIKLDKQAQLDIDRSKLK